LLYEYGAMIYLVFSFISLMFMHICLHCNRFEVVGCRMLLFTREQAVTLSRLLKLHRDVVNMLLHMPLNDRLLAAAILYIHYEQPISVLSIHCDIDVRTSDHYSYYVSLGLYLHLLVFHFFSQYWPGYWLGRVFPK